MRKVNEKKEEFEIWATAENTFYNACQAFKLQERHETLVNLPACKVFYRGAQDIQ